MTRSLGSFRGGALAALLTVSILPAMAAAAPLPADTTAVISGTPDLLSLLPAPVGTSSAGRQAVSQDGSRVVFISQSDGLVVGDDDTVENVYVKSLATGAVELVSRGDGENGEPAHDDCSEGAISSDGHHVAFTCGGPLDPADTNSFTDVYVRNLDTQRTTLISRLPNGGAVGDRSSDVPAIAVSGSTTFVAFSSEARNLIPSFMLPAQRQVYRRVIGNGVDRTDFVNAPPLGGVQTSGSPSISDDGQRVAFDTSQKNAAGDVNDEIDVYLRDFRVTPPATVLVSVDGGGVVGNFRSQHPVISGDGSAVAFDSLSPFDPFHDHNTDIRDVYVRKLTEETTELVSASNAVSGDNFSHVTGIDDSGTVVGFESLATNLDVGDPSGDVDGFVLRNGTVSRVSRGDGAGPPAASGAESVSVSGDGTKVAMTLHASGLDGDADPGFDSVLLRDLPTGVNQTVSRPPGTAPFVNEGEEASGGSVSADGRFVAFESAASALGVGLRDREVFVRDVVTGAVTLVSRADGPDGAPLKGRSSEPRISADGRRVAFLSADVGDPIAQVLVRDIANGRTLVASRADGPDGAPATAASIAPSISDDGSRVSFLTDASLADGDGDDLFDAYVRELASGRTLLASRPAGVSSKLPGSRTFAQVISGDGRSVAFATDAPLDAADANGKFDIYVRDLDGDLTRLASVMGEATLGDGDAVLPSLSRDGNRVAFFSSATNLGAPAGALFVRDLAARTLTVASRADGPDGTIVADISNGVLSADGAHVAFAAAAPTSVAPGAPGDGAERVYERDLASGTTRLISRQSGANGAAAAGLALVGGITADGAWVTFTMRGTFVPQPANADVGNVFMRAVRAECGRPVPPAPPGPPLPPAAKPAVLSGLKLKPARFHVGGRKGGTKILFRLDKRSAMTLRFDRLLPGHRAKAKRVKGRKGKAGRCSVKVRKGKRCTVAKLAGRLTVAASRTRGGANTIAFSGKLGRKALKPGRYRLTATPLKGKARTVTFTVVKTPKARTTPHRKARR